MSVIYEEGLVRFEGHCEVHEAESFADWLRANPSSRLDLSRCIHMHTALLQLVLTFRPELEGSPDDVWLRRILDAARVEGL